MTILAPSATRITPGTGVLDEPNKLHGYAARFDMESAVLFDPGVLADRAGKPIPFVEIIRPGAFARSLVANPDILALYNHDWNQPLGRTSAGTLTLREDEIGLGYELTLADTGVARDTRENVRIGNINGCSFFGHIVENEIVERDDQEPLHVIHEFKLIEITPACVMPAYDSTSVYLRSRGGRPPIVQASPRRPVLARSVALLGLWDI